MYLLLKLKKLQSMKLPMYVKKMQSLDLILQIFGSMILQRIAVSIIIVCVENDLFYS